MSEWIASAASSAVSPVVQRPGARLLLAGGEERDQVERVAQPLHDLVERRGSAVAKSLGLLVGQLGELRLELQVDPRRAVDDRDQRLRRQRLEPVRQLARVLRERRSGLDMREHLLQLLDLGAELRVARLRLLLDALEPLLRRGRRSATSSSSLKVSRSPLGIGAGPNPSTHDEQRLDLAQVAEQRRRRCPATSWTRIVAGVTFRAWTISRQRVEPLVGDRRHADVRLAVVAAARLRQRREERRLARCRQGRRCRPRVPSAYGRYEPKPTRLSRPYRFTKTTRLSTTV